MSADFKAKLLLELENEFSKALSIASDKAEKDAAKVESRWAKATAGIRKSWDKSANHITKGTQNIKSGFQTVLKGAAIAAPLVLAIKTAADFEKGMAEIATLTKQSTNSIINDYGDIVEQAQITFGRNQQDVIKALYDGFSAGVDQTKDGARDYLDATGKMATGGVTDMKTAGDALTSAKNAWKSSGLTFTTIADQMFVAVREGKTTMSEIGSNIGQVASVAAMAGVSLGETMSALAALTAAGVKTPEAMTQIKATISSLIKPTQAVSDVYETLKLRIDPLTLKTKGLKGTLDLITRSVNKYTKSEAKRKSMMADLFPNIRAYAGVSALAGEQSEKFAKTIDMMTESGGSADGAYRKMAATISEKFNTATQQAAVAWKHFGAASLPIATKLLEEIAPLISQFSKWISENKELSGQLGKGILAVAALTSTFGLLKMAAGGIRVAFGLLTNPLGAIIAGVVAWTYVFSQASDATTILGADLKILTSGFEGFAAVARKVKGFFGYLFTGEISEDAYEAVKKVDELSRRRGVGDLHTRKMPLSGKLAESNKKNNITNKNRTTTVNNNVSMPVTISGGAGNEQSQKKLTNDFKKIVDNVWGEKKRLQLKTEGGL